MAILKDEDGRLMRRYDSELLVIEAWGENSVRATRRRELTGAQWTNAFTREEHAGGTRIAVAVPLMGIPLFLRDGESLPIRG
jgi:alpha-D-xyloside xylohydrolase